MNTSRELKKAVNQLNKLMKSQPKLPKKITKQANLGAMTESQAREIFHLQNSFNNREI